MRRPSSPLRYVHFNSTLWRRVAELWPGDAGAEEFAEQLATLRGLRAEVQRSCALCDVMGGTRCVAAAQRAPTQATPHLCWQLRQDTSSWSEHFFSRMALRFDAVAAANITGLSRAAPSTDAGVVTGNVRWWRCSRAVDRRCAHHRRYSAWDCLCPWPHTF
uniref:Uncharacterized protein n=1 Tax=Calcidiscus leptoporus TaxID=127549 RepID=A0A7S0JGG7_9EUKA